MTNAEWMIKHGYKFTDLLITYFENSIYKISVCGKPIAEYKAIYEITHSEIVLKWLDMEHREPILNDAEREYLKMVLKPFHENVAYVEKVHYYSMNGDTSFSLAFLFIKLHDEKLKFPNFDSRKMYLGMELNKKYKLDELGITYEEEDE